MGKKIDPELGSSTFNFQVAGQSSIFPPPRYLHVLNIPPAEMGIPTLFQVSVCFLQYVSFP